MNGPMELHTTNIAQMTHVLVFYHIFRSCHFSIRDLVHHLALLLGPANRLVRLLVLHEQGLFSKRVEATISILQHQQLPTCPLRQERWGRGAQPDGQPKMLPRREQLGCELSNNRLKGMQSKSK